MSDVAEALRQAIQRLVLGRRKMQTWAQLPKPTTLAEVITQLEALKTATKDGE